MKVFDFTDDRVLSKDEVFLLETIGNNFIDKYNSLVTSLRGNDFSDIGWWSSSIASRFTLEGSVFDQICLFFLFEKNINKYSEVKVDEEWKYVLVHEACKRNNVSLKIQYDKKKKNTLLSRVKAMSSIILIAILRFVFFSLFATKKTRCGEKWSVIKLYALSCSYRKGEFEDRYFPGLYDYMEKMYDEKVVYFPTFSVKKAGFISIAYKMISDKRRRFIFPEEFLPAKDFLLVLNCFFKGRRTVFKGAYLEGYNFSRLLSHYWSNTFFTGHRYESILNYFAIKAMKKKGANISRFICWTEGQSLDKCIMLSLKNSYPNLKRIGYCGYIESRYLLSTYPIKKEIDSGVTPDSIGLCSSHYALFYKELSDYTNIILAPGFRLHHPLQFTGKDRNSITLLFLLSSTPEEVNEYLRVFDKIKRYHFGYNIEYIVRPHPILPVIEERYQEYLSSGPFSNDIEKAGICITGCSTAGIEAMLSGCYTIVIQSKKYLTRDPLASISAFQGKYKVAYDEADIIEALVGYEKNRGKTDPLYKEVIVPVNENTIAHFLQ